MALTLAQLAAELNAELRGPGDIRVSAVAPLARAGPQDVSFLANPRYRPLLPQTRAAAVILDAADAAAAPGAVLISDRPYAAYARAVGLLHPAPDKRRGVHPSAVVDASASVDPSAWVDAQSVIEAGARIGPGVQIGPGCVIGAGVCIDADSELLGRVTVLARARLGKRVRVQPGAVIGGDGFGMAAVDGHWERVPQIGSVSIGDDVDIGANTTIDRGALRDTVIEEGVKIDNQVQVAHNVVIGAHTAIAGCVGISGSATIGRHCTLAGGVGIVGHLSITDHVHITGMSMVTHSITRPGTYSAGTPLMDNRLWRRNAVRMKHLDRLAKCVKNIEKAK